MITVQVFSLIIELSTTSLSCCSICTMGPRSHPILVYHHCHHYPKGLVLVAVTMMLLGSSSPMLRWESSGRRRTYKSLWEVILTRWRANCSLKRRLSTIAGMDQITELAYSAKAKPWMVMRTKDLERLLLWQWRCTIPFPKNCNL